MLFYKSFLVLLSIVLININSFATIVDGTATPFGVWSTGATWDSGSSPTNTNCYDTITISEHVYITDQTDLTACTAIVLIVDDTLRFQSGKKLHLPTGSSVIVNSGGWLIPEGFANSNLINIGGVTVWNATSGATSGPIVLSIELSDFYAIDLINGIQLNWITASETNNAYFNIEYSRTGEFFNSIGRIEGAGTSILSNKYQLIHSSPNLGINYYRLKQTDFDGKFSYSSTISINYDGNDNDFIFPNPARNNFTLTNAEGQISIYRLNGESVLLINNYKNKQIVNTEYFSPGVYIICYKSQGKTHSLKLIID